MKKHIAKICMAALVVISMLGQGCKKDSSNEGTSNGTSSGQSTMNVRMTDGPGSFDKVYLDIQEVWVNMDGKGWVMLTSTRRGMFNILAFNNGDDTLIATGRMSPGHIKQIKLVLGTNNHVMINGVMQVIDNSGTDQSRLVIDVDETVNADQSITLWIDIDAGRSMVRHLNGWWFKPWLRCFTKMKTGSIKGDISPAGAVFFAYAVPSFNVNDTFGTYVRSNGEFRITGLKPGSYHMNFLNSAGTTVKSADHVSVNAAHETDMGTVTVP